MIVVGIILVLTGYLAPPPATLDQIAIILGWILAIVGTATPLILGTPGRRVNGRRYWY
ncbi:hypothetical protein CRM90_27320 [Mycobacterium sp. ENV421]|uniref:DUF6131 family protein n=1 Tax=Mycobacterium sp. ENV421 TaxID=1213407 RepID=UPI000CC096E2|nr:DUF6131 family protein [Mycobacterium sp. ENV421]PND54536.1 hypothetical protein CRM90_27320 [Mycobacterium sp. ENV421]